MAHEEPSDDAVMSMCDCTVEHSEDHDSEEEDVDSGEIHTDRELVAGDNAKLVIAMCGLPARGKSFIARKIQSYLTWRGLRVKIFNAGKYRRMEVKDVNSTSRADYFDTSNKKAALQRERFAMMALQDMLGFFRGTGDVGIFDATNTTKARRANIVKKCKEASQDIGIIFIESICDEPSVIETNIRSKVKNSPDFKGFNLEEAIVDIKKRIKNYESRYETLTEDHLSYIKLYNLQSRVFCNRIYGRIGKALLEFLMAIHIGSRTVCLTRPGAPEGKTISKGSTLYSFEGKRKQVRLSAKGKNFAKNLGSYLRRVRSRTTSRENIAVNAEKMDEKRKRKNPRSWDGRTLRNQRYKVMTSLMDIAIETADLIAPNSSNELEEYATLNPMHRGIGGLKSVKGMKRRHPKFYDAWMTSPLKTRWPGGESYDDVRRRIQATVIEIEQQPAPVVVVSHIAVIQLLIAYFTKIDCNKAHTINVPLHTAILLDPLRGGTYRKRMIQFTDFGEAKEVEDKDFQDEKFGNSWNLKLHATSVILISAVTVIGFNLYRRFIR